jgi:hypothetical protein
VIGREAEEILKYKDITLEIKRMWNVPYIIECTLYYRMYLIEF